MAPSARGTPGLRRNSRSISRSRATLRSTGIVKGSMRMGETHSASYFSSGASVTSCFLARVLARSNYIEEQGHVAVHRDSEGIDADGRDPLGLVLLLGRERDVVLLGESAGALELYRGAGPRCGPQG